jgi:DNA-binding MarR family transcriptional regulator
MSDLSGLMALSRLCCALHSQMRLSQLTILLAIAEQPGRSQTEIAAEAGLSVAAISRAVDVLGSTGRRDGKGPALGLIEAVINPDDDRHLLLHLTPRGRTFLRSLLDAVDAKP